MAQNYTYPYYYPQRQDNYQQFTPQVQQGYRMIPVSDIAEANATTVDTNGQPTFFYNKGKGEIYLKQFDINTGGAMFQRFQLAIAPNENTVSLNTLNDKLDAITLLFEEKGKKKKVEE